MRIIFLLALICSSFISLGQQLTLDTLDGNIQILLDGKSQFEIPISSVRLSRDSPKIKDKFASYKIKRKEKFISAFLLDSVGSQKVNLSNVAHELGACCLEVTVVENELKFNFLGSDDPYFQFEIIKKKEESIYGGGVQFSHLDFTGHTYDNITEENGIGRGDKPISRVTKLVGVSGNEHSTYFPSNSFVTSSGRLINVKTNADTHIKFNEESISILTSSKTAMVELKTFDSTKDASTYLGSVSKVCQIPNWAMLPILGLQGGSDEVMSKLNQVENEKAKIGAIWIQDWVGKRDTKIGQRLNWQWRLDKEFYNEFDSFKGELSKKDMKLLGYVNPFFAEEGHYISIGISKNYFVQSGKGENILFDFGGMGGYMLDLFNDEAYRWMKEIIVNELIGNDFSGWMADFAEWLPVNKRLEIERHNQFAVLWQQMQYEIASEHKMNTGKELFIFHRSGNQGITARGHSIWAGDQMETYGVNDGLPSVIRAMQNVGVSGLGLIHSDVGGYTAVKKPIIKNQLRTKELFNDWQKMEAFTPVFRTHEGLQPAFDLQVYSSDKSAVNYSNWSKVHNKLIPYFEAVLNQYYSDGVPIFYPHLGLKSQPNINSSTDYLVYVGEDILITFDESVDLISNWTEYKPTFDTEKGRVRIFLKNDSEPFKILYK